MAYKSQKELKLFYSISEVAKMFDVKESLLRYWEKEFSGFLTPQKSPKGIRQYRKEDLDNIRLIYHLVKERGMTLPGARQKLKASKDNVIQTVDVINHLKTIKEELLAIRKELDML